MMLQKNLTCYYENQGPKPFLIYPNGTMEELQMNKFSSSYLCMVVFRGAMEPLSSLELMNFSNNISKFQDLDCKLVGMARDSPMVLQDWMVEPMVGKGEKVSATFPCISCPNLGADDVGLIQAVGVPLVNGFPIPTIIIVDKQSKVRYFASFSDSTCRSVEETLRMVAAIKMVDVAKGSSFAPADWESNQPTITNTKAGVLKYYQEKYKEEGAEEQGGLLAPLKKKLCGLYESLFGASSPLDPAEANTVQDTVEGMANAAIEVKGKDAEEYSKYSTREPSNEAASSEKSKEDTHEKGANGDGK